MSHDRGCSCGREKWDYEDCPEKEKCAKWCWVTDYDKKSKPADPDKAMG